MAPVIELAAARKRYGDVEALAGVDLAIEPGGDRRRPRPERRRQDDAVRAACSAWSVRAPARSACSASVPARASNRLRTGAMLQGAGLPEQVTVRELVAPHGRRLPARRTGRGDPAPHRPDRPGPAGP